MEKNPPPPVDVSVKERQQEEYETQLFGFSSRDVFEGVKDGIVPQVIANASESLKLCLVQNFNSESQVQKITLATEELSKKCNDAAEAPLSQLKTVLDGHFQIPPNALLPEDKVQYKQYTAEEVEKVHQEIKDLQARAKVACFMEAVLEDEIRRAFKFEDLDDVKCVKTIAKEASEDKYWLETVPGKVKQLHEASSALNSDKTSVSSNPE